MTSPGNPAREVIAREILKAVRASESTVGYVELRHVTAMDIIAALSAAGMVIVPKLPSGDMIRAGGSAGNFTHISFVNEERDQLEALRVWQAMLAALPTPTLPPAGDER